MEILQLCNRLPWPLKDGGALATWNMMASLHAHPDVELHVASLNTKKHFVCPDEFPTLFRALPLLETVDVDTSLTLTGTVKNLLGKGSYNISRFYHKTFVQKLEELLARHSYEIIQLEGLQMTPYVADLRRLAPNSRIVLRAHNVEHQIWQRLAQNHPKGMAKRYMGFLAKRLKTYEEAAWQQMDAIVAITEEDARQMAQTAPQVKIHTAVAGLDLARYGTEWKPPQGMGVFHLGAMDWMPNQQAVRWLVGEIWPFVTEKVPQARLHLAGRNMPEWVQGFASGTVAVHGEVEDAVAFMAQHAAMAVPLQSGGGMRLKVVEGMAAGKAIVSTAVGAEGVKYTHGKDILIADGAEGFAQALVQLLNDPEKTHRLGQQARQTAHRHYSNEAITAQLLDFYHRLLNAP